MRLHAGLMMLMDTVHERGFSHADIRWGDSSQCNFPLFSWLSPLPLQWMYVVYWIVLAGIVLHIMISAV